MVCEKCEKKLGKVITPNPWKAGARNTVEAGGRKVGENKALTARNGRFNPYTSKFHKCNFKIIDDNLDLTKLRALDGDELIILDEGEDGPQIAGIIDDRPEELKKLDQFKANSKWRVVNQDDGFNSKLQIEEIKRDIKKTEKENEIIFGKMYSDSEDDKKNDSDPSPPRKSINGSNTNSKKHQNNSDSDFSPPRKGRQPSPKNNKIEYLKSYHHSDLSPPRKQDKTSRGNKKPRKHSRWADFEDTEKKADRYKRSSKSPKKYRKQSDSDVSPPRMMQRADKKSNYDSDFSLPRKSRKHSPRRKERSPDSDISPPRKRILTPDRQRNDKYNKYRNDGKHRKQKSAEDSDSDLSPPRKSRRQKSELPSTKYRKKSPENRRKRQNSDSDISPPRKSRNLEKDRSYRRNSNSPPPSNKKMAKTLEGKRAGLQNAVQLKEENDQLRRKEESFNRMADIVSGRNAQVVFRKSIRETSEDRKKQREKAERQKELDEKYKKWSKGMKQIKAQEARAQEFMHEASKPLARHKDDRDLEDRLKEIERDGDPMLQYIREKKRDKGELGPEKPSYKGSFSPNRFNIGPGYRWDGVDRSNGYEKKFFDQQSKKKAQEEEAYKWSTENL